MGKESTKHAKSHLRIGKQYRYDVIGTDRYKRSICVVYTLKGVFNELMVRNGYALPFEKYLPKKLKKKYHGFVIEAKRGKRGPWRQYSFSCLIR